MIAASKAYEQMIIARQDRVKNKMYEAIKQGFIGVVVESELVSDAISVDLVSLGYKVFPIEATSEHGPGIRITWSEKV